MKFYDKKNDKQNFKNTSKLTYEIKWSTSCWKTFIYNIKYFIVFLCSECDK